VHGCRGRAYEGDGSWSGNIVTEDDGAVPGGKLKGRIVLKFAVSAASLSLILSST
jgi:hypothetical protein